VSGHPRQARTRPLTPHALKVPFETLNVLMGTFETLNVLKVPFRAWARAGGDNLVGLTVGVTRCRMIGP
jgi:hypothetical protein